MSPQEHQDPTVAHEAEDAVRQLLRLVAQEVVRRLHAEQQEKQGKSTPKPLGVPEQGRRFPKVM